MNVTFDHGSALMQSAFATTNRVGTRLARGDMSNLAEDMVTLTQQKHTVSIGSALVRTADEMTGTLLDVLA